MTQERSGAPARMFLAALVLLAVPSPTQEPASTWRIRVFEDSLGQRPAVGAVVRSWFGMNSFESLSEPLPEAVVDVHGEARVDLTELERFAPIDQRRGKLHATVHQVGYRLQHVEAYLGRGELLHVEEVETLSLGLSRGWCGRVLDAAGRPVPGARVILRTAEGAAEPWIPKHPVRTNGQEIFEIEGFSAFIYCAETGFPAGYLTEQGVPFRGCMAPTYSPAKIAPGSYRLRMLWSGSGLPSEHPFEVSPGEPAVLRIPSPGWSSGLPERRR